MKIITLLSFASVSFNVAIYAQSSTVQAIPFEQFLEQRKLQTQKDEHTPLAMVQRCMRTATYVNQVLSDSTRSTYTHPRGSIADKNAFNIGSAPDSLFQVALNSNVEMVKEVNNYGANNIYLGRVYMKDGVQVGTDISQYGANNQLELSEKDFDDNVTKVYQKSVYSNGKRMIDSNYQFVYAPSQQAANNYFYTFKYQYDNQDREIELYRHYAFNNYTTSSITKTVHYYQGNNTKPYLDSIFNYYNNGSVVKSAIKFYYLPNGQITRDTSFNQAGIPTSSSQYTYNGLTTTMISRVYNANSWSNSYKSINNINNDGNYVYAESYNWNQSNGSWILSYKSENTYNGEGYLLTTHTQNNYQGGNLQTIEKNFMERNSYNNTKKWTKQSFNNGSVAKETTNYYYYEDYDNGVSLNDVNSKVKVSVYPNPANAVLNIDFEETMQSDVHISIFDLTGKLTSHHQTKVKENKIDIKELATGQYLIQLSDKSGRSLFSQKFLKK